MATRMQQRRGAASQWTSANTILAAGEIGFETDTFKFKIGNGTTAWNSLAYFVNVNDIDNAVIENISLNDLSNVTATAPSNGQALIFNSGTSSWAPGSVSSGTSGGTADDNAIFKATLFFGSN